VAAQIRLRGDGDLDECVLLLEAVHRVDSYPTYWPEDPGRWLSPKAMLSAWVAERRGRIVGHIALDAGKTDGSAAVWSEATGLPPERLAAITRLFVSLEGRGTGVGRALLDAACGEAAVRGLHPALDVVETNLDAIRLYERCGWRRVFTEPWRSAHDGKTLLHYYVAPPGETGRPSER
jgi:GNAT superfamily N-acetyltransferase